MIIRGVIKKTYSFPRVSLKKKIKRGCFTFKVGPKTTSREIQCLCNHLTSFAAQVVVEPNVIEFEKALKGFIELTENHLVFSVVLSILGVYVILLIWARRLDIRNAKKVHGNFSFLILII